MNHKLDQAALIARSLGIGYARRADVRTVAADLNLTLRAGEFVCLLGPNGVGKSTLIRTLAGMQPALAGQIEVAGKCYSQIPPRERARLVSVVLTESTPVSMLDAYSMVALGRHPYSGWFGGLNTHDHERIAWALSAVGAQKLADRPVTQLSDGERQRITIARALAQETRVMLLDEPTAFLDLPRRVELMQILRLLAEREQLALLLSTHDLDLALRFADRLWVLTPEGRILSGYPEALALSGAFAEVFKTPRISWDPRSGNFRAHPNPSLYAQVSGEGVATLWTKKALERLGFGLIDEPTDHAALYIKLRETKQLGTTWHLQLGAQTEDFDSIESLIDWLRSRNQAVIQSALDRNHLNSLSEKPPE